MYPKMLLFTYTHIHRVRTHKRGGSLSFHRLPVLFNPISIHSTCGQQATFHSFAPTIHLLVPRSTCLPTLTRYEHDKQFARLNLFYSCSHISYVFNRARSLGLAS